jgi:hypothetical protein
VSRASRDSAATRAIRTRVESKATGKLSLPGDLCVHLLHGDILAATARDDDQQIVRMLHLRGLVDDARAEDLESLAESGGDVFGEILTMGLGVTVDPILRERFLQNLSDFVNAPGTPKFLEQRGVFVANIQMGHVTAALLDDVCRMTDLAKAVDAASLVVRGSVAPGSDPVRQAVADALSSDPRSVETLLNEIAVEPTRARVVLAELLLDGVAIQPSEVQDGATDEDDTLMTEGPVRTTVPPAMGRTSQPDPRSTPVPAPPVTRSTPVPAPPVIRSTPVPAPPVTRSTPVPAPPVTRSTPVPAPPVTRSTPVPQPVRGPVAAPHPPDPSPVAYSAPEPLSSASQVDLGPEDLEPLSEDGEFRLPEPQESAVGAPRSLADYLTKTAAVGADDLDFFSDHDHDRGGEADGRFKTETRNLDKIEVDAAEPEKADEIEVDEAPSSRFGAPPLTEEEALAKIEVVNEVMETIATAFDDAEGSGRGRAVVQLLVDGVPNQFAALLHDLRIDDEGHLPAHTLLRNLADRPATEHRQLLNNSLADIIERALSNAADELPDDKLDGVLESVAGYRGRLGL